MWAVAGALDGGSGGRPVVVVVVVVRLLREEMGTVTMCDVGDVSTAVARFGNSRAVRN